MTVCALALLTHILLIHNYEWLYVGFAWATAAVMDLAIVFMICETVGKVRGK
jgi:hypothetical protein